MRILICIKGVSSRLVNENADEENTYVINPYDLFALNDVLKVRREGADHLTCITMGVPGCENMLLKCLAMGADESILLTDPKFGGADTIATSYTLATAINKLSEADLIICGKKAVDGETGQVAYGLSEWLSIPCIMNVEKIVEIKDDSVSLVFIRKGRQIQAIVRYPVICVFREFSTESPSVSLLKLKKARKQGIATKSLLDIGADPEKCGIRGSRTKVLKAESKMKRDHRHIIVEGTAEEKAGILEHLLQGDT